MNTQVDVIVEIPYGSVYKYEVDKKDLSKLTIDRPLPCPLPYNYGFISHTLHGDGDPLDACVIGRNPIFPLTKLKANILGAFICIDNGESDDKLVVSVVGEHHTEEFIDSSLKEIEHYLSTYKEGFEVKQYVGPEEARKIFIRDVAVYYEQDPGN